MSHKITAIYENGVLRPLSPLDLPERSQVEIDVHPVNDSEAPTAHHEKVRLALFSAGLILPVETVVSHPPALSSQQREELARLFSAGRPLSEIINEDRESR